MDQRGSLHPGYCALYFSKASNEQVDEQGKKYLIFQDLIPPI